MVSVAVCSYNRARLVGDLLSNLSGQPPPRGHEVEILFVDNNSTDGTAAALQSAAQNCRYRVRYFLEEAQGLSHARNRCLAEASGEWIVFVDDDSVPEPDWLHNLITGVEALGCLAGGGPVQAVWPRETPRWVAHDGQYRVRPLFGHMDLGQSSFRFPAGEWDVSGANMVFHRSIPKTLLRFDPALGASPGVMAGGEESELFERLTPAGVSVAYIADACVRHPIDLRRCSFRGGMRYAYRCGYSNGVKECRSGAAAVTPWRVAMWQLRRCGTEGVRATVRGGLPGLFWAACQSAIALGDWRARRDIGRALRRGGAAEARRLEPEDQRGAEGAAPSGVRASADGSAAPRPRD